MADEEHYIRNNTIEGKNWLLIYIDRKSEYLLLNMNNVIGTATVKETIFYRNGIIEIGQVVSHSTNKEKLELRKQRLSRIMNFLMQNDTSRTVVSPKKQQIISSNVDISCNTIAEKVDKNTKVDTEVKTTKQIINDNMTELEKKINELNDLNGILVTHLKVMDDSLDVIATTSKKQIETLQRKIEILLYTQTHDFLKTEKKNLL